MESHWTVSDRLHRVEQPPSAVLIYKRQSLTALGSLASLSVVSAEGKSILGQLIGHDLVAVTFVLDCFQLQFGDGSRLNITTAASLQSATGICRFPEPLFVSGLVSLIGQLVSAIEEGARDLDIFLGGSALTLSLRPEDFHVEAYDFHAADGGFAVQN